MSERLDEISMFIANLMEAKPMYDKEKFKNIHLNNREKEIFLVLYTSNEELTIDTFAKRTGLTYELVDKYLQSLISKGIPVLDKYDGRVCKYTLEKVFKQFHAKENILNIVEDFDYIK